MTTEPVPHGNVAVAEVSPEDYSTETVTVDFLYLDRDVCERCRGTEEALHAALEHVGDVLEIFDVDVAVRKVHVDTETAARQTELAISPTIRVDGRDIQPTYAETACESSSDLCTTGDDTDGVSYVDCREWYYRGETHTTLPVALLVEEFLRAALVKRGMGPDAIESDRYRVPENLQTFFDDSTGPASDSETGAEDPSGGHTPCC